MDNIINAAKAVYGNYFGFSGKESREFWGSLFYW